MWWVFEFWREILGHRSAAQLNSARGYFMDATLDWLRRLSSTLIRPAQNAVPLPEKRGWLSLNGKRFFFSLRAGRLSFYANENTTTGGKRFNLVECHVKKVVSTFGLIIEITREKKVHLVTSVAPFARCMNVLIHYAEWQVRAKRR